MPKLGKEWEFQIVRGKMLVGEADYCRFAVDFYVLDKERHIVVPISSKPELFNPKFHLKIDRADPAFIITGLDVNAESYYLGNEIRPENMAGLKVCRGKLTGALAEAFAIWTGRSTDPKVIRGRNPGGEEPACMVYEFMPWRDDRKLYRALIKPSPHIALGLAEYDQDSRRVLVCKKMWPNWYWWVYARSQQAWDMDLTPAQRRKWVRFCRSNQQEATDLLMFWMSVRREVVDIADANRQAQIIFAEACMLLFAQDSVEDLSRPMAKLATELGAPIFWGEL